MGSFSLPHILILAIVAILLLGGGRFSSMMGDVAKGVKNFKKGMSEEDEEASAKPAQRIEAQQTARPASETIVEEDKVAR
ncbi:Sec-independent protein translocase subunit TatA [Sphingomonas sp. ABOLG]|jgi:sec-independent protein translocase protein TatA|uniref:Sec-independent protein translocase protein TatA n=1 Tax=Sphingomonas olei TaxID=1886787 RepID=A0ABY2QJ36_9SPHN|nr:MULTISPECIES: Sec-independent protein translocase subunit TatA [Sphingomonas]KKI17821.1 preprotein translocase subunit TatA [Sphingomonas sp. Ag1]MDF2603154.1 Sec-independent protein translocase TatA [Sphingomonas sp.]RSV16898.1 Sec-independent protein translocase subunit TatA [Sphingomonas sp. ABOLG]THG39862.1 Sec-independent protein translocase subunit TatA [Sphingomonas olei]